MQEASLSTLFAVVTTLAACGGEQSGVTPTDAGLTDGAADAEQRGELSCAWFEGDNCWRQALAPVASCLPPRDAVGSMSTDDRTCTFPSGHTVVFATPLRLPILDPNIRFNFTVTYRGQDCLAVQQASDGLSVTTSVGIASVRENGDGGVELLCPRGARYVSTTAASLFTCAVGMMGSVPLSLGYTSAPFDPVTSISIGVTPSSEPLHILRCRK